MRDLGHPLSTENWMKYCNERHPLLPECFITFLRCVKMLERAPERMCITPSGSKLYHFSQKVISNVTQNVRFDTLSEQEMGRSTARADMHCCLSMLWPSLGVSGWAEELLKESWNTSGYKLCHYWRRLISNFMQDVRFRAPSQKQEIQWCTARRDIHCFLRVSWPSLDVYHWYTCLW